MSQIILNGKELSKKIEEELKEKADIVLADVPCSGLGVIGRKPDIKFKMNTEAMDELVPIQRKILANVRNYVKPGGVLMFSTCTVNEKENQENVGWFLEEFPEFQVEDLKEQMPEEIKPLVKNGQLQLLPEVKFINPQTSKIIEEMMRK